eukprot:4834488-Pyramimonas_sp.AAC.1
MRAICSGVRRGGRGGGGGAAEGAGEEGEQKKAATSASSSNPGDANCRGSGARVGSHPHASRVGVPYPGLWGLSSGTSGSFMNRWISGSARGTPSCL